MVNSQTGNTDPWAVSRSTDAAGLGVSAQDARHNIGALSFPGPGSAYGFGSCVFPGGSPNGTSPADLQVTPSSGMTIAVRGGGYQIDRGATGPYIGAVTTSVTVTHPASNPSNPRVDYVVLRSRDPGVDGTVTESARIVILAGSPSANPVEPAGQLTTGDYLLAAVTVRANTSSILLGDISPRQVFGSARGGIYPKTAVDERTGAYEGQYRDNLAYNQLERWSGTAWEAVATPAVWNQWTPPLIAAGTGADINIGTGSQRIGRFQLVGKRLDFNYFFKWGTPPYNGGYGNISTRLPVHPVTGTQLIGVSYNQWTVAQLWVSVPAWQGDFFGQAILYANTPNLGPFFPICSGHMPPNNVVNMNTAPFKIATQQGVADGKSSVPQIFNPVGFPEGGQLTISGSVEVSW